MSDNVIDFNLAKQKFNKEENDSLTEKRKEAISKLPNYRGEVPSKTAIRSLPEVKPGQIFWVSNDHKAYLVAEKTPKKMTIKALDETATLSTGMTIFEMNKNLVSREPLLDLEDTEKKAELDDQILKWFNIETNDRYYLLYGRDIHYVTLLCLKDRRKNVEFDGVELLNKTIAAVGDLISIDFNTSDHEKSIEIWIRTKDSPAELLYLFPFDKGLVEI